jgi:hypothetical protein
MAGVLCPLRTLTEVDGSVAPVGPDWKSTLWTAVSLLVHTIVLFTPTTTVMVAGAKLSCMLSPTPEGIDTMVVELPVEDDAVDEDVVCRVVLLEVVEDVVVLLVETEPETTVMVPFIHEW